MITLFKFTFVFFTLFCLAQTAAAATYTVTKTADTNDGACDADCSLREAIAAANASAENDMISFSINVFKYAANNCLDERRSHHYKQRLFNDCRQRS